MKPILMVFFSSNNLRNIEDETNVLNFEEQKLIGIHWIVLYVDGKNVTYFNSFGVKHIPKFI